MRCFQFHGDHGKISPVLLVPLVLASRPRAFVPPPALFFDTQAADQVGGGEVCGGVVGRNRAVVVGLLHNE